MLPNLVSVGLERAIRQNMDAYNVLNTANISKMLLYCEKNSQSSIKNVTTNRIICTNTAQSSEPILCSMFCVILHERLQLLK